jgi:hypothetical protein
LNWEPSIEISISQFMQKITPSGKENNLEPHLIMPL